MACKSNCKLSKEPHEAGKSPFMVATIPGGKFGVGENHSQCADCMLLEAKLNLIGQTELNEKALAKAFSHSPDDALFEKFKKLKAKI